ncbi:hypothetical protein [Actinocrispum sp. NPDC049592]|uniref:hypothetical protein n=1 Tax=Actinocrispum sp. NPDC049592 TaxID=3154835 RepID=UPI003446F05E
MDRRRKLRSCALAFALIATMPPTPAAAESTWRLDARMPADGPAELTAVDVVPAQTWVGGTQESPRTGKAEPIVGLWDGRTLARIPSPASDPARDVRLAGLAVVGDEVLAVANSTNETGVTQPVIQRYSRIQLGQSDVLPTPAVEAYGELNAVVALPDRRALTVGATGPDAASTRSLILEQNEDHDGWHRIPSASPGTGTNQLNAVTDSGWAAGHYTRPDERGRSHPLVLHDEGGGAGWTQVSVPDPGPELTELTGIAVRASGDVFVAGWTGSVDDPEHRSAVAMHWTRGTWEMLRPANLMMTQFNDVTANSDGTVTFAGYTVIGVDEVVGLETWTGSQQLGAVPVVKPPTPPHSGSEYPASGANAIDAGPAGSAPCAVGWLRQPGLAQGMIARPS